MVVFGVVAAVYLAGGLDFIERRLLDARSGMIEREARGNVALVAVDSASLRRLPIWPWPRGYHATVLENLQKAGANRVAFDIDFSSRSVEEEDRAFARALSEARHRVVLPVFQQWESDEAQGARIAVTEPLPQFARHALIGTINVHPDPDGLVRRYRMQGSMNGGTVPSFAAALAGETKPEIDEFYLDFGIDLSSVPRISFIDVLMDRFDPRLVEDRVIIVGATAVELGDQVAVPRQVAMAGPLLQALALESIVANRQLRRVHPAGTLLLGLLLAVFLGPGLLHDSWRRGLVHFASASGAVLLLSWAVQSVSPHSLDTSPLVISLAGVFGFGLVRRIDQQSLVLLIQGKRIRQTETMMHHVVQNSFDAIVTLRENGRLESFNRAAENLFGRHESSVRNLEIEEFVSLPRQAEFDSLLDALQKRQGLHEALAQRATGHKIPVEMAATTAVIDGKKRHLLFLRDITDRKQQQMALEHQATHDALTNLPNRYLLRRRVQEVLATAREEGRPVSFLLLDLDRFKEINDTLGHHTGDLLLQQIARRLRGALRPEDTIARLGGDEFAVLLPDTDVAWARLVAKRLRDSLERSFRVDGLSLQVDTSIGISLFPEHGQDASRLIQRADVAMYVAKRSGGGIGVYDPEVDFSSVRQLSLTGELRNAIDSGELQLHYQPKMAVHDDSVVGVEALVRWRHPVHGNIPPDEFIGLAERSGLIRQLTEWVLKTALAQSACWSERGLTLDLSVNISARNLLDEALPRMLQAMLEQHAIISSRLTLEITESMIMEDPQTALDVIVELAALGVRISIDDFGTGYSSLGYLKQLPAAELKIDKSFVMEMDRNHDDAMIVHSTIDLAHNMGLQVVAEGVETEPVWRALKKLGCDVGQGYLFSRPLPPEEFEAWCRAVAENGWVAVEAVAAG